MGLEIPFQFAQRSAPLVMDDGHTIIAKQVVIALGFKYYKNEPQDLVKRLPADLF